MSKIVIEYIGSLEKINPLNDNIDVHVTVSNKKYFATFFTVNNIITIMNKYKKSRECLSGQYFWAADMCIVTSIDKHTIESCIYDMLKTGEFYSVFCDVS
jgi:hypothetical protein